MRFKLLLYNRAHSFSHSNILPPVTFYKWNSQPAKGLGYNPFSSHWLNIIFSKAIKYGHFHVKPSRRESETFIQGQAVEKVVYVWK